MGPVSGAVSVIAVMVGNGLALAGQAGATAGPGLVADLRHESFVNSFGVTLEMVGWAALMCFIGYLFATLRRAEPPDGWWSPVALAAGVLLVALKLGSVAPLMAAWSRRDDLTVAGGADPQRSGWCVVRRLRVGHRFVRGDGCSVSGRVTGVAALAGMVRGAERTGRAGGRHGRCARPDRVRPDPVPGVAAVGAADECGVDGAGGPCRHGDHASRGLSRMVLLLDDDGHGPSCALELGVGCSGCVRGARGSRRAPRAPYGFWAAGAPGVPGQRALVGGLRRRRRDGGVPPARAGSWLAVSR